MSDISREDIQKRAAIRNKLQQRAQQEEQERLANEQGFLADSVDAVQHGLLSGTADLADGIGYLTGSDTASNVGAYLRKNANNQIDQMSTAGRESFQSFGVEESEDSPTGYGFKDGSSMRGFGLNVLSGVGSFAPTMIPGGIAAKGISTAGKVAGATGRTANVTNKVADVAGFGGVGALAIGGSTGNQAYETIMSATPKQLKDAPVYREQYLALRDQGVDHKTAMYQARENIAKNIGEEAAKDGAVLGAITQGAFGPALGRLFRGEAGGFGKSIAHGAATEGTQELIESGGQRAVTNVNVNPAVPTETMEGVVGDALTGAMTGAAVGGALGGAGRLANRNPNQSTDEDVIPEGQSEVSARADELQAEIDQLDEQLQNDSDTLTDEEYAALLQRREALLREQMGEADQVIDDNKPFDMAGPQQQQPLGLPNQNIVYGQAPEPTQEQLDSRERTRQAYEGQHGTARNTGIEGEYLGNVLPQLSNRREGELIDGEFTPATNPQDIRQRLLERKRKEEQAKLQSPEGDPQPPRFDTIYGEYQPSEQQQTALETTRRSFEDPVTEARQSRKARDEAYQLQKQQQEQIEQTRRERQQQEVQKRQREDQVALGQLEVGSEVKAAKGAKAKAYTPSNKPIDVEYQVVEASDLTTSHDDNFQARADYPQALQNRDRSSPALRKQVEDNAKNLIPEKLGEDSGVVSGAPIIRNGVVESGNGRTMSIRRAYNENGAANYRQYLEDNAERLGISKDELGQFNQPVLVRQRLNDMTPDELTSYTKDANTTDAFALNPVEQAKSDSNRLSDDDMALIDIPESGDFAAASNRSFVRKFLSRFPKAEQNAMLNGDGTISDGGISRVQNAIFAKAYGSDQLIEDITSTSADDMKTVAKALINAAPEVAKLNAQGGVEGFTDTIVDAVNIVKRSRRDDVPVKELTDQFDLMSENTVDPTTASLANYLDQNVRSIKRMTDAIKGAAQRGQEGLRNSQTDGLFGRAPAPTVANILDFGSGSTTPSGKQINGAGKQSPDISEQNTDIGKENAATPTTENPEPVNNDQPEIESSNTDEGESSNDSSEPKQQAAKDDVTKPSGPTERIDDVGEKMAGAKKDQWKRFQDSITSEVDIASEPLSKSFPQPDYEKLVDKGESQRALALVALLRNQIPAKPKRANRLESWVKTVNAVRETAAIVMESPESAASILDSAIRARVLPKEVIAQLDMMETLPPSKLKEAATYKIGVGSYSIFNGERFNPPKVVYSVAGKQRIPELSRQGFDTAEEAAGALEKYLNETGEGKASKNFAKLDVYRDRYTGEAFVGWRSSAGVLRVEVFENTKQAREAITDRRADLEAKLDEMKRVPSMRETVNLTRVGPERRTGNVDAEQFRKAFGFKGVQFGNYVEQGKRQKDLNEAYDALMDLSELLNIPPQAISLNGQLGLAFGARGHGKYSAHYEPDQVVINLTKKKGSGSLAHEWWHALDNYFGSKSGNALFMSDRGSRKRSIDSAVRQETADAFANVMLSIEQTGLRDRSSNLDNLRSKPYWATKVEMSARAFEAFVKTKLTDQERSNDYLANIRSEEVWGDLWDSSSYPYPTHGEMSDVANAYKDLFDTLKNRETEDGIELFSVAETSGEGMKADDVAKTLESLVSDLHEKNTFNVVQSINDLPFAIRLQAKAKLKQSKGENPVLRGINAGDKNYLIADSLRNEKEAIEIFLHEVVGHKAVLDMLGKDGDAIMERIALSYGRKGLEDLIKTYGVEPNTKEGRILLGKEKVAHMAERGEKPALLKRLVAKVKSWLRNYFPSIKWSDNDVLSLISNARDQVENRYMTKLDLDAETETNAQEDSIHLSIRGDDNPKDVNDIIGRTQAKPEHQKGLMERAADRLKAFKEIDKTAMKQAFIDSYAAIESLEKKVNFGKLMDGAESAYKAALRTANLDSQVEAVMRRGALKYENGAFQIKEGTKGFLEIFQKIADSDQLQLWETWAGAKRAKRIMEEDARANLEGQAALKEHRATINQLKKTTPANHPGGLTQWRKDMRAAEKGMAEARTRTFQKRERLYKPSDIQRIIKYVNDNPELKKEFEQAQSDWRKFNKSMLDMAEQAGLIDPEARAIWEHDDYVPFHRVAEIEAEGGISQYATKRGLSGQKSGIKQLKGGVEKLNIIESMVRNVIHLVDASNKNVAMQRVVDLADGVAMEKLPTSKIDPEERDMMLRELGYEPESMDQDTLNAWSNQLERYNSIDKGVVSVSRNGKLHKYHVTDTGLFAAITQLGPMRVDGMLKILGIPKRVLTASVTAAPGFMSANFVRDTLSTWVTVEPKTTPVYDAIKGAAKGLQRSETQWAIMAAGAGGGGYYDTSPDSVRQHLSPLNKGGALHKPKQLWDAWMRVGQALENANRIAVYESVVRNGGTVAEAAHQAQDVINFSKRGANKWVQGAITLMPFLNARIQGLERLYRGAKENPKAFFMKGAILMGASLALLATNWDNEEYWELDEWDRDANWHIFAGGEHFKIPKPFEVGAFFGTVPERVFEQLRSDASGKLLAERMLAMVTGTFAFDPLGAQFMKPAVDVMRNKNGFTDNPILGFGDQFRSPEGQYSPWTSETMKQIAESMPDSAPEWMRSPKRLEYLFKGYFGTLGGYALSLTDMATQKIVGAPDQPDTTLGRYPVVKRFYSDELTGNKHVGRFYDMAEEVNAIYSDMKTRFDDGQSEQATKLMNKNMDKLRLRSHLNKVRQQMSDISSQIRMIYMDTKMSSTEKRRRIDKLTKRRNQIARAASLQFYGVFN